MASRKLFVLPSKAQGATAEIFRSLYKPLIPRLRKLLHAKRIDIFFSPFIDFLQLLIASYVLGSKPRVRAKLRKIACGCNDCNNVNSFLRSSMVRQTFHPYSRSSRVHMEKSLTAAADLTVFEAARTHSLVVTKCTGVVASLKWETGVVEAKEFLNSISTEDRLSKLIGNRYADVLKASRSLISLRMTQQEIEVVS